MTSNLMIELMNGFRGDSLNRISSAVGASPATTQTAIAAALPALMGGLVNKASTTDQASNLLDLITRHQLDSDTFAHPSTAVNASGGINSLMTVGGPLMDTIFGDRSQTISDSVASHSGLNRSSSSTLLSIALPIVLGLIAKRIRNTGWNASNLMKLMGDQRAYLRDAVLSGDTEDVRRRDAPATAEYETAPRNRNAWLWALPLLLLIPLIGYFLARQDEPRRDVAVQSRPAPREAVPAKPEEKPVGTTGTASEPSAVPARFVPYRLEFETGSLALTAASFQQVNEIAELLRAHPQAKAEIMGYTDNAGNEVANLRLSQERATAVMNKIADLGIDRSRMIADGYGESNPVAPNATTQGRQQNRRVEVEVTDR